MNIKLHQIPLREVVEGYTDSAENGVKGYGGKLDIRPAFQREFVYTGKQRVDVMQTILKGFPLNVMYWVKNTDGTFEVLDGQQRTISFCQYVNGDYSVKIDDYPKSFNNLTDDEKEKILDYPLMIYFCEGTDKEKLEWFKIINIAGEELTEQELRNAVYHGPWLEECKKLFSRWSGAGITLGKDFLNGKPNRQDYLKKALEWIANRDGCTVEDYMAAHQNDPNCNDLWAYFNAVITWITMLFPHYRKEQKGVEWGIFYNDLREKQFDAKQLEARFLELLDDDEVQTVKGIYEYLLDGQEKHLNLRVFSDKQKRVAYEKQGGVCAKCGNRFDIDQMEADHIIPWSKGGKTEDSNCQMLCMPCIRAKSDS